MITGRIYCMTDLFMYQYGSTIQTLNRRLTLHKNTSNINPAPCHKYFNNVGWDNVFMVLIEEGVYENMNALHKREGEIIALHRGKEYCLNIQVPGKLATESKKNACVTYRKANREMLNAKARERYRLTQRLSPSLGS